MCFPLPIWYREVGKGFSCPDVFDAEIEKGMRAQIAKMCEPERGQKNLIGYWFTDVPLWDLERSQMRYQKDWVTELRRLPATTPGKAAYVRFLLQRYQSKPEQMQQHYGITSKDEAALMQHDFSAITRSSEVIKADDNDFLGIIAERYYSICTNEVRLRDPGALVLGDRYAENDHTPQVLAAAGRYIDAVPLQPSSDRYVPGYLEKLHHQSGGKPVIIADYRIGFPAAGFPKHTWRGYPTEAEAAAATKDCIVRAFAEPWVIGYNHCELADKPHGRAKDVIRNGFFTIEGKPYEELVRATREANETVLRQRGSSADGLL